MRPQGLTIAGATVLAGFAAALVGGGLLLLGCGEDDDRAQRRASDDSPLELVHGLELGGELRRRVSLNGKRFATVSRTTYTREAEGASFIAGQVVSDEPVALRLLVNGKAVGDHFDLGSGAQAVSCLCEPPSGQHEVLLQARPRRARARVSAAAIALDSVVARAGSDPDLPLVASELGSSLPLVSELRLDPDRIPALVLVSVVENGHGVSITSGETTLDAIKRELFGRDGVAAFYLSGEVESEILRLHVRRGGLAGALFACPCAYGPPA